MQPPTEPEKCRLILFSINAPGINHLALSITEQAAFPFIPGSRSDDELLCDTIELWSDAIVGRQPMIY